MPAVPVVMVIVVIGMSAVPVVVGFVVGMKVMVAVSVVPAPVVSSVPVSVCEGDVACCRCSRVADCTGNCTDGGSSKLYHAVVCCHERENKAHWHP